MELNLWKPMNQTYWAGSSISFLFHYFSTKLIFSIPVTLKKLKKVLASHNLFKNMPVFFGDKGHIHYCCESNLKDKEPEFDWFLFPGQLILTPIEPDCRNHCETTKALHWSGTWHFVVDVLRSVAAHEVQWECGIILYINCTAEEFNRYWWQMNKINDYAARKSHHTQEHSVDVILLKLEISQGGFA